MERNEKSGSTYLHDIMYLFIQIQHLLFHLCRLNIHIFVHSVVYFSFSIFCGALSSIFSPFLHTFHLQPLSRLQGIHWMDSPAIRLAALCPLSQPNQNQYYDVGVLDIYRAQRLKTSTFSDVLMRVHSFQLHILNILGTCLANSAFSSKTRFVVDIMFIFHIRINEIAYCNTTFLCVCVCVCMYVCMYVCM